MISIISPLLNCARYVEEMLTSVERQGDVAYEHIVMDGGSTDGTIELVKRYAGRNARVRLIVGRDSGQSDALNKGFQQATGEYVTWLNGDDHLKPGGLHQIMKCIEASPARPVLAYGLVEITDERGSPLYVTSHRQFDRKALIHNGNYIPQPGSLLRRDALSSVGGLNASLRYCMDYDLWIRLSAVGPVIACDIVSASFRLHSLSKTGSRQVPFHLEHIAVARHYGASWLSPNVVRSLTYIAKEPARRVARRLGLISEYRSFLPGK